METMTALQFDVSQLLFFGAGTALPDSEVLLDLSLQGVSPDVPVSFADVVNHLSENQD